MANFLTFSPISIFTSNFYHSFLFSFDVFATMHLFLSFCRTMMGATVKTERHDEAEIAELAKKMIETNKAKTLAAAPPPTYPQHQLQMARPGQPGIQNYLNNASRILLSESKVLDEEKHIDERSRKGQFGWFEFDKSHVPFIYRNKGEKFTSVRMVERKLLNKFLIKRLASCNQVFTDILVLHIDTLDHYIMIFQRQQFGILITGNQLLFQKPFSAMELCK